ncbi:MAG: tetratricopeptide repeat protein, partial [Candidatus Hydrogenedentes bacterium]|nr:tetratricopeptide repeat protein [Candidatus Hydrogenedentota bacterium]
MRRKTRILILAVLILTLLAGGGGAIFLRQRAMDQRALESRARGMEAARAGNNKEALHQIGTYLQRFGQEDDAEAVYEYAHARRNIALPNNKHIQQAIALLLRLLATEPNHTDAQHELLDLYLLAGYGQETLNLAQKLLEQDSSDIAALRAEAQSLARLRRYDDALGRAVRITELAPLNLENHFLTLALMDRASASDSELLAYPELQKSLDPKQHTFQMIQAAAYELTRNSPEAEVWAKRAAESVDADSTDVLLVNKFLNRLHLYSESLKLLARTALASDNLELQQLYCTRLFEAGDMRAVMAQTEGSSYSEIDSTMLAIRAMACAREKNTEELQKIVSELDTRSDDTVADAWVPLLRAIWLGNGESPQEVVRICSAAVEADQSNPFFYYFQGLAYEQLGEKEQAIIAWQNTIQRAPVWIDPLLRGAGLLAGIGRHAEAAGLAQEALKRAPKNAGVAAAAAEIIGANINGLSASNQQNLLKLSQEIQNAKPLEPRTLPLVVDLLARQGDTSTAAEMIQSALDSEEKLPERTLLKLAQLSDQYDFGLSQACFDKLNASGGTSPGSAYAQALSFFKDGDPQQGRDFLENAATAAGNNLQWQVVIAQYLEFMGSEDVLPAWAAIAEAAPDNAMLQRRILSSKAAWEDTAMIDGVIERLRSLTGDNSVTWRAARARWLLQTDHSQKAAAEAASLLNDTMRSSLPEAHRYALLASALERLKNTEGAIDCLEQAARISPDSTAIRFELIRLLQNRGKTGQASRYIDTILSAKNVDPNDLRRTAALLARQNDTRRAIDILLQLHPAEDQAAPRDMLLARLYRRVGQFDKAELICKRFLQEEPNAGVIEFAAALLASQGRTEEAQATLSGLDTLELTAGIREMILAEYNRYYGTPEEANRWYEEAIAAANDNPAIWKRMLAFQVRTGALDQAIQRIPEAYAACPEEETFATLAQQIALLEEVQSKPLARPFILAAIESPERSREALRALEVLKRTPDDDPARLAIEFRVLTEQTPSFLPLKMQLVRLYGALNRHADAATLAAQAMLDFPNEIEPALLAAESFAANGKWVDALGAAKEWRRRSPSSPDAADLMIASAQIRLDQSSEALETIQPYLQKQSEDPNVYSPIIANQARALIHSDRADEAADLLRPRLSLSSPWRMAWLQLAVLDITAESLSVEWLEQVASLIPEDAVDERVTLASAWHEMAERTQQSAYRDNARTILESLAKRPDASGRAIFALAVIAEREGNNATAETNYPLAPKP